MADLYRERVELGDRAYDVVIGHNARQHASGLLDSTVRRVAVVTQQSIPTHLIPVFEGREVSIHHIGEGEEHKSLATIEQLCRDFARAGLTRHDAVVAVGGGMVTDVGGFAASVYHRGIAVVHVATSLLAMIDAAIGGKTGVNLPEGKNLVGAFWQPHAVICDLDALATLPSGEVDSGNGEMAKYHFIAREDLASLDLTERIARCVRIKADIVAADEREGSIRALLNYGHTLGHALEVETGFALSHGEAVALGVLFAGHLAHVMGRIDTTRLDDHYRVVHEVYGLRRPLPAGVSFDRLMGAMARDKKATTSLTFVLDSATGLEVVPHIDPAALTAAFEALQVRVAGLAG